MRIDIYKHSSDQVKVVAGLLDEHSFEFFAVGFQHLVLFQGKTIPIEELPESILFAIEKSIEKNEGAKASLLELNKTERFDRISQYLWCQYGGFDNSPDMSYGKMGEAEYWPCPLRGNCPHEFKLCAPITGPGGKISMAEFKIIRLLGQKPDLADKQIADEIGIATNTVCVHLANIRHKLGLMNRASIIAFAISKGISTPLI
jgi:DNA-binding CsgD family transcriptional regulator